MLAGGPLHAAHGSHLAALVSQRLLLKVAPERLYRLQALVQRLLAGTAANAGLRGQL